MYLLPRIIILHSWTIRLGVELLTLELEDAGMKRNIKGQEEE